MNLCTSWQLLLVAGIVGVTLSNPVENARPSSFEKFESDWPIGDPRRCQEQMQSSKFDFNRFEALPGFGWDNLRNVEAGMVVTYNFSQCKMTDDGELLIPDNVFTVPIKFSSVETLAEIFDHWLNTTSVTSFSINTEAGVYLPRVSVSGKFSFEHEQLKSKQIEDNAVTIRVKMYYKRYEAKLQPDPVLDPQFKKRLLSIATSIQMNHTEQAFYKGQLLVRDFGTHVITSVTAGAALVKDDYMKREYLSQHSSEKKDILASASATFYSIVHMGSSISHTTTSSQDETYLKQLTHSFVKSYGGPKFQVANMTLNQWIEGLDKNLVPLDRAGDPLYFFVTPNTLPELPPSLVADIERIVKKSVEVYYEMNTIRGCTKLGAPNFSFSANFDDGSCYAKPTNMTFGGVFQTCTVESEYYQHNPCSGLNTVNPKTGSMSCPTSYTQVILQSGTRNVVEDRTVCDRCYLFFKCCHTKLYYSDAVYTTYWCAATGPVHKDSGYMFGGLYSQFSDNPVTGSKTCPPTYYPRRIFKDLDVCISDDFEFGSVFSTPFGGFFSCEAGNPLASDDVPRVGKKSAAPNSLRAFMQENGGPETWPSTCPTGYSQHLATDDLGCAIHYCVLTGALSAPYLPPVKRPPFMAKPATLQEYDDNMVIFNVHTKDYVAYDKVAQFKVEQKTALGEAGGEMSAGVAAAISVVATLACVAVATMIIVVLRRQHSRGQNAYRSLSDETTEPATNYGSTNHGRTATNVTA